MSLPSPPGARKMSAMGMRRAIFWLTIAASALCAGYAGIDLRLIAGVACGLAAIESAGLLRKA